MRILAEFSHPAQVHKFKFVFRELIANGHSVLVLARKKDVMLELLEAEALPYECISVAKKSLVGMALELLEREFKVMKVAKKFKPDIMFSAHSVAITHVGRMLRVPVVLHDDTEHATLQQKLYMPFANHIITSSAYTKELGIRQHKIDSIEPLAYLHPSYFTPNREIPEKYGLTEAIPYAVIRLVSWNAAHDVGQSSSLAGSCNDLIRAMKKHGVQKVVLSSEQQHVDLSGDPDIIKIKPQDLHHILAFSRICVSEGGSVANERRMHGEKGNRGAQRRGYRTRRVSHRRGRID